MASLSLQFFNQYRTPGAVVGSGLNVALYATADFVGAPRNGVYIPAVASPLATGTTDANGKVTLSLTAQDAWVVLSDATGYPWWFPVYAAWVGDGNYHSCTVKLPL